jgi:CRP-like cAMP-binding protein
MNPEEIKAIAVLQGIDSETLARLAEVMEQKDYPDGTPVFSEGDPGDSMYFIVSGRIRIEKRAQAAGAVHKTLTILEAGDYFGEMALFDQKPRSASAVAVDGARVLRLSKPGFDGIRAKSGAAAMTVLFAMIRTSGERIRRLSAQLIVYDEVGKAIGEARDLQELLNVVLQQLSAATGADWGLVLLHSQFSARFEVRAQVNVSLTTEQREALADGKGFVEPALRKLEGQLVDAFGEQEPFSSCCRLGFETPSLLLSPITVEAECLGLIVLGSQGRGNFDLDALNLVRGVARQAGQAILNARHREEEQARSRHARQFVRF